MGGQQGTVVNTDDSVAIFNAKPENFLVYFDRNLGGDIGWDDSARWEDTLPGQLKDWIVAQGEELVKEAVVKALLA